ncbi:hypothetical protein Kpol_2000p18 [Vanderwaltozyma polyspora DSM 70294]|uniref:Uncharacterized protein n=1 Tax=Vanderwaltozyma polyspora (strain ATCC 22028 / DSM 70294 / BCRC 21397 / CBS 2163 / NBRC 10782 / NRRL Y-8283 / UCD 57-17) TaxID=436907 RepID=A7TF29_VANPO|nr:uncharacterized protein Kpol_2000p18 [Vanderwaltozyma polyspora DSM 70294]EDO19054.1 hypothetical protein Kpol_2000p18 [Vanderwaltozyma polyspora DSM 70294]
MNSIDLSSSNSAKEYLGHLVPCKIRYNGPSDEFTDNFNMDNEEMEVLNNDVADESKQVYVNYIRGRKIIGQDVLPIFGEGSKAFLTENVISSDATMEEEFDNTESINAKPIATLNKLINYERDGNESRLSSELQKFQEYIELNDIIHNN